MKRRKNFGKTAVAIVVLWAALAFWIWQITPEGTVAIGGFFFLAFWALWLSLSVILANARRGLLATVGILGSLALKLLGMLSYVSFGAWWIIVGLVEFLLSRGIVDGN